MSVPAQRKMEKFRSIPIIRSINRLLQVNRENCDKIRGMLKQLIDGRAWIDLGYPDLDTFAKEEFKLSRRSVLRKVDAAIILESVGIDPDAEVPDSVVLPLAALPAEERPAVWREATRRSDGQTPTRTVVAEVVKASQGYSQKVEEEPQEPEAPEPVSFPGATIETTVVGREPGDDDGEATVEHMGFDDDDEETFSAELALKLYVEKLPLRGRLAPDLEARYVAGAIAARNLYEARERYRVAVREQIRAAQKVCRSITPPYLAKQMYAVGMPGAPEWLLCKDCNGQGRRSITGKMFACTSCNGHGYRIPRDSSH